MNTLVRESEFIALHRYWIWGNSLRDEFLKCLPEMEKQLDDAPQAMLASGGGMYMSYWYATLYVVVEGWRVLGLTDKAVDALLASPNTEILRRYRNGVFHYQGEYDDARFIDLFRGGADMVGWVHDLNREFGRVFLQTLRPEQFPSDQP